VITCRQCGHPQAKALCDRCRSERYGPGHQLARRLWAPAVATGRVVCSRSSTDPDCPGIIDAEAEWDLDHTDEGSHPAHAECNRRAGARSL
jgi:hypothetical protein